MRVHAGSEGWWPASAEGVAASKILDSGARGVSAKPAGRLTVGSTLVRSRSLQTAHTAGPLRMENIENIVYIVLGHHSPRRLQQQGLWRRWERVRLRI
jgi:hypothetical protein